jgi:Spy/CpxP family protein refolding chaperone
MTTSFISRMAIVTGTLALTAAVAVAAAGASSAPAQDISGQDPAAARAAGPSRGGRGPGGPAGPGRGFGGPGRRGGPGRPGGPGGPLGELGLRGVDLTAEQRQQVRAVMESHQAELQALHQREQEARDAMRAAVTADIFDEGAIRARSAEVAAVAADSAVARARIRAEVLPLLTPDQRQQAAQAPPPRRMPPPQ